MEAEGGSLGIGLDEQPIKKAVAINMGNRQSMDFFMSCSPFLFIGESVVCYGLQTPNLVKNFFEVPEGSYHVASVSILQISNRITLTVLFFIFFSKTAVLILT